MHARTHAHTHARTHTRTHARTHTHTHRHTHTHTHTPLTEEREVLIPLVLTHSYKEKYKSNTVYRLGTI